MPNFWTFFLGSIALAWATYGVRTAWGAFHLPRLRDFAPAEDSECPEVALIFAARDEEEKLPAALASFAALDYPRLEIIGVDDRSRDATGRILDEFAAKHANACVIHVRELPSGWLGKPHALQMGTDASSAEWILFTDADVQMKPDVLRRAMRLALQSKADYVTLLCHMQTIGFWERTVISFFILGFHLGTGAGQTANPRSSRYTGIGAFQLVRRTAYEAAGAHRRLALEIVDDMKLGRNLKKAGARSVVGVAMEEVSVRWHAGIRKIIGGVTKNLFAGAEYNLPLVAVQILGLLTMDVAPFVGLFVAHGWALVFAGIAAGIASGFQAGLAAEMGVSPLYGFTHPLGALLFCYMLARSTVITLRDGGVTWRGTFYPLAELKRATKR